MLDGTISFSLPNTRQSQGPLSQFSTIIILRSIAVFFSILKLPFNSHLYLICWEYLVHHATSYTKGTCLKLESFSFPTCKPLYKQGGSA